MMNMGHLAETMSLHDYEELLHHWNEAHDRDGAEHAAPDPDRARKLLDQINSRPELTH